MEQLNESTVIVGEADIDEADLLKVATQLLGARRNWAVLVGIVVATALFLFNHPGAGGRERILTVFLPMVFIIVLATYFQRGMPRAWAKQALINIGGRTTFRFDDYGFISESATRQHRLAWGILVRALEKPETFLIYTTPQTVLIVPKRAFAEADVSTVSRMLRERIAPAPPPKTGLADPARRTLLLWVVLLVTFLSIWHFLDEGAPSRREHPRREYAAAPTSSAEGGEASDVDSSH